MKTFANTLWRDVRNVRGVTSLDSRTRQVLRTRPLSLLVKHRVQSNLDQAFLSLVRLASCWTAYCIITILIATAFDSPMLQRAILLTSQVLGLLYLLRKYWQLARLDSELRSAVERSSFY
jgi:hypothetical protein